MTRNQSAEDREQRERELLGAASGPLPAWTPDKWHVPVESDGGAPWILILGALPALVSGHVIAYSAWKILQGAHAWLLPAAALSLVFFAMGYLLDRERRLAEPSLSWIPWFLIALTAGQLVALLIIHGLLDGGSHPTPGVPLDPHSDGGEAARAPEWLWWTVSGVLAAAVSALFLRFLHHHKDKLREVTTLGEHHLQTGAAPAGTGEHTAGAGSQQVEFMVLPLSPPRGKVVCRGDAIDLWFPSVSPNPGVVDQSAFQVTPADARLSREDLAARARGLINDSGWRGHSWQHMLRAIVPHAATLTRIWLIGSVKSDGTPPSESELREFEAGTRRPEGLGSAVFLEGAAQLIHAVFPFLQVTIVNPAQPLTFHEVEPLRKVVLAIIHEILGATSSGKRVREAQIVVDATGALKTSSIVGAMCTLHNHTRFQYVATNPPFDAIVFNVSDARTLDIPG